MYLPRQPVCLFFFFNDTATTEIYTLSLHDALPISRIPARALQRQRRAGAVPQPEFGRADLGGLGRWRDRKSTRLNSSHLVISYAVFCLKKKNNAGDSARTHVLLRVLISTTSSSRAR